MTPILAVGRNIKWMMTLNLWLIPLKKITEITIYIYLQTNKLHKIYCE